MKSKKRTPRIHPCKPAGVNSKGIHGATKHPLTEIEKALLGKGIVQRFKPIGSVAH